MASLCREFGISRVTGYKIYGRYKDCGLEGLTDRARTPYRYANKLPAQLEAMIVSLRREKPAWGARKLRDRLLRKLPNDVRVPACSTIHAILDRHGLVARQRRSRTKTEGTPLSPGLTPNALWCTDYKGEFMLGDKRYCYPLTVSDHASRYLLLCEAMESVKEQAAFTAFERLFKERGLPHAIRSDNGVPFASPNSLFNLSRLSVWWLRLGITIERIRPGHPQQNGRHERMHRTLKMEATRPAGSNFLQQQAKFDAFVHDFNNERPHEALDMKYPAEVYKPSTRPYRGIGELSYPFHDRTALVTCCGRICIYKKKINLSTSLAGQAVGIKEVDDGIWLVSGRAHAGCQPCRCGSMGAMRRSVTRFVSCARRTNPITSNSAIVASNPLSNEARLRGRRQELGGPKQRKNIEMIHGRLPPRCPSNSF
jgi:transposase InsO family protein